MNRAEAEQFVRETKQAVVVTIGKNGRPQTSNALVVFHDGELWMSITETRVKYRNLVRDPRVTLHLLGGNFWQWLAVEGTTSITHMPDALPLLREYYELASGEPHPNWEEYDRAMAEEQRVLAHISIERMYPVSD
jgi:PPOX class probable F420-dependent enzyme